VTIQPTTNALGDAAAARALAPLAAAAMVPVRCNYRVARRPRARGGEVDLVRPGRHARLRRAAGARRQPLRRRCGRRWLGQAARPARRGQPLPRPDGERIERLRAEFDPGSRLA
jgi:hypothetical protein